MCKYVGYVFDGVYGFCYLERIMISYIVGGFVGVDGIGFYISGVIIVWVCVNRE